MTELARYGAMLAAIAAAHAVDEVLDIHDKARALEVYAQQAKNTQAERQAADIRIRAERRTGELLRELPRSAGGRPENPSSRLTSSDPSPYAAALAHNKLSRQTAATWQRLAAIPAPEFEQAMREPDAPSTSRLIAEHAPRRPPKNAHERRTRNARDKAMELDRQYRAARAKQVSAVVMWAGVLARAISDAGELSDADVIALRELVQLIETQTRLKHEN